MILVSDLKVFNVDCLQGLSSVQTNTFDAIITSPPYFDPSYYGQEGLGFTEDSYVENLSIRLSSALETLKPAGALFLNLGEISPNRIPWKVIEGLVKGGFLYFGEFIWRQNEFRHDSIYILGKSRPSWMVAGDFASGVWDLGWDPRPLHFPESLVEKCLAKFSNPGNVLDPFAGFGTTGVVAKRLGWGFLGFEKKTETCALANKRISDI